MSKYIEQIGYIATKRKGQKELTGENESDDSKDETAAERDETRHDDVTGVRLDMTDQHWMTTTLR